MAMDVDETRTTAVRTAEITYTVAMSSIDTTSTATMTATGKGDARRAAIVRAAREICLEKGFSRITVSDIASRVHMTRSLFYHYFPDKDAVADAVLDDVVGEILSKLEAWNASRETGNIDKALDDMVQLIRALIANEGPFSARMIHEGNAELYIRFIDRIADRIADLLERTVVRDFALLHGMPITNVHETFFTLIVGLISLIRSHANVTDATLKSLIAQTLHLTDYLRSSSMATAG